MSSPNAHAAWHSQPPLWEGFLDWEEPDADDLGPRPNDTPIRLSWWAMEAVQADVDLASPRAWRQTAVRISHSLVLCRVKFRSSADLVPNGK